ncbi:beta-glucosidase [Catenuloplanes atrovinosus]|uniref:Beta-glucosidase n=1 Tax=Catenuloplanes atrovinosus TaxID=137266 RepID=A0AAE3YU03_9ACTN|nr:glycoside hydrolase family 3 C-terminal domain-containing protein [Catenuloplanes atrovinosus]MDR7278605.1 beta-glucosidase [Catenuloplanes atrovinosus]
MSDDARREEAVERAVARLGVEDKVRLLSGQDFWALPALPEIGLASLVMSDGPVGVRGTGWAPDDPSVVLPSPTALAATWDVELARTAGRMLGQECRRKGVHVLLAPTVNLHRSPLGGRHFECYSEDPLLTGEVGAAYVTGVQDQGVGTTVKHFVGNDSETDRMSVDVRIGERALRELYLAPFARITAAGAWGAMAAYNTVNGLTMTEHGPLQNDVLKREWGWDGAIVSDWTAARSTVASALGGLDVVMPAFGDPWGPALLRAVRAGEVPEKVLDDKVRRVLRLAARVGILDGAPGVRPSLPALDGAQVAREIATRSFVLARNERNLLPLDGGELRRVALLGALAADARVLGGGSAQVFPPYVISPRDGLAAALPGASVVYAPGADPRPHLPALACDGLTATLRGSGFRVLHSTPLPVATVRWMGAPPSGVDPDALSTVEITGRLTPPASGVHELSIIGFGQVVLRVAGDVIFEGAVFADDADPETVFHESVERRFPVPLTAGEAVDVSLTLEVRPAVAGFVNVGLGYAPPGPSPDELLDRAVAAARDADVAVVVVGTTEEVESEGFDRTTLALPGRQDELVRRVAAANPRTIVVVNAGSPVLMPWLDEVPAVLLTWFPGQEAGAALADVLLGLAEPGGRLPTTWPRRDEDALSTTPSGGILAYEEGVFVGYRSGTAAAPLFPFGHGLGYTTWSYESIAVETDPAHAGTVVVRLRNTGSRPGREIVQIYLGAAVGTTVDRPDRWLAGFAPVSAAPGHTVEARIPLPPRAFQIWDDGWQAVPGTYRVEAAHSLHDRRLTTELSI